MTYDYSSGSPSPGPNAPLKWVRMRLNMFLSMSDTNVFQIEAVVKILAPTPELKSKMLVGLNFYGMGLFLGFLSANCKRFRKKDPECNRWP
jgi:hypothetical protein